MKSARRFALILLADHVAIGVAVAAVVDATVVAVSAVGGGSGGCGSYCCGSDCCTAIRISAAPARTTIGHATICAAAIGYATACNGTAAYAYCANTGAAATIGERVIGNKRRANKDDGSETYESFPQHWCSPDSSRSRRVKRPREQR
jgi:hypothetical protein